MDKQPVSVFWFRRDLRLHDNHGLYLALKDDLPVLPIFIFDKHILDDLEDKDDIRITFIFNEVHHIKKGIEKVGSSLIIKYDTPKAAWQQLLQEYNIKKVYFNHDYEPYAIERDKEISALLNKNNIEVKSVKDQVIFERKEILNAQDEPYKVFTPYKNQWLSQLDQQQLIPYNSEGTDNWYKMKPQEMPAISDMGFEINTKINIPDKEIKDDLIKNYDKTRDIPAIDGTSRASHHLRFGTISIRNLVTRAKELNSTYLNELIWREFYMMILFNFPYVVDASFNTKYDRLNWRNNEEEFALWCEGKTGVPLVDAGMRQLNETAFMHNRIRMITASYLTKNLLIDWRWGEAYFARKLLDYELASNNGGWQWVAGTGTDAAPYFRVFNPITQQKKFDPDWKYIKKWIPEINSDKYPNEPIADIKTSRERALAAYKKVV